MSSISMQPFDGSGTEWNSIIARLPGKHLLQTSEWAKVKSSYGWHPMPIVWEGGRAAAAMVLRRVILDRAFARRLCILYVPKGPLLEWQDPGLQRIVLDDLQALARDQRAVLLKIDPDLEIGRGYPGEPGSTPNPAAGAILEELERRGWRFSEDQVQFRNTVLLDLTPSEDALLAGMKQKTRYNLRLAERKGVVVRPGGRADLPALYEMYAETSVRDDFVIRSMDYYRTLWETFLRPPREADQPFAEAYIAEVDHQPIAAVFVFIFAGRAYYLHGMSTAAHREKMPNYLLQWEAIRSAKRHGCLSYDLWGAPDVLTQDDALSGVYRFKQGLGGEVVRTVGAWDFPPSRIWYGLYTRIVPRLLDVMRLRGKRRVRQSLGGA